MPRPHRKMLRYRSSCCHCIFSFLGFNIHRSCCHCKSLFLTLSLLEMVERGLIIPSSRWTLIFRFSFFSFYTVKGLNDKQAHSFFRRLLFGLPSSGNCMKFTSVKTLYVLPCTSRFMQWIGCWDRSSQICFLNRTPFIASTSSIDNLFNARAGSLANQFLVISSL